MRRDERASILTLAGGEEIEARIVISAEGVRARLARQAGIMPPQMILSGAQVEVPFAVEDPEKVEVHLGPGTGALRLGHSHWTRRRPASVYALAIRGCEHLRAFLKTDVIRKRICWTPQWP